MNVTATRRNINVSRNINKSISNLKKKLGKTSTKETIRNIHKKIPKPETNNLLTGLLSSILVIALLVFIFSLIFHLFTQKKIDDVNENVQEILRKPPPPMFTESAPSATSISGAPVSSEGPDDAENAYLSLYGSPDAPGFRAWGTDNVDNEYPFPGGPYYNVQGKISEDPKLQYSNVPRSRLNEYVNDQNSYIREINDRVRQINRNRMYSQRFLRNRAELRELRNFERRLANKVHRERENQPLLPDNVYY
jgi:hypothetical protein